MVRPTSDDTGRLANRRLPGKGDGLANRRQRSGEYVASEERYAGYTVRDRYGERIGKVSDLFADGNGRPEYFGVTMNFLGTRSTLIPVDAATVDESSGFITVSQPKSKILSGPAFENGELTTEHKKRTNSHYGL